jgi:FkbM family methyltransferase
MIKLHQALTKLWLWKYKKKMIVPSVSAVFLGDFVSTEIILHGAYEKYELKALENFVFSHLNKNSCCLDIGANIGNHSCTFSNSFSKVYSFEPNPPVRYVLQANTYGKNIEVIDCGLSNKAGTIHFKQNFSNLGASHIVDNESASDISIDIDTLDSVVKERDISNVSFVKIDVEGHEAQVLAGGENFFKKEKPIIALEAIFLKFPEEAKEVMSTLETLGYRNFYTFAYASKLTRVLRRWLGAKATKMFTSLLPTKIGKSLILTEVRNPLLANHLLLICSHNRIVT